VFYKITREAEQLAAQLTAVQEWLPREIKSSLNLDKTIKGFASRCITWCDTKAG
jgi:hypothetical protein